MLQPKFKPCTAEAAGIFLGTILYKAPGMPLPEIWPFDLYYIEASRRIGSEPTLTARFGDDTGHYVSGLIAGWAPDIITPLVIARQLAQARGLVVCEQKYAGKVRQTGPAMYEGGIPVPLIPVTLDGLPASSEVAEQLRQCGFTTIDWHQAARRAIEKSKVTDENVKKHGILVICKDENAYYVATRQLMTLPQALLYMKTIHPSREPMLVLPVKGWDLRPVEPSNFSEDLDFTVQSKEAEYEDSILAGGRDAELERSSGISDEEAGAELNVTERPDRFEPQ